MRVSRKFIYALLGLLILINYLPVLEHKFIWDDPFLISYNSLIHSYLNMDQALLSNVYGIRETHYYRPLVSLSFLANYHFVQTSPWLYHVTNILFHAVATLLIGVLLSRFQIRTKWVYIIVLIYGIHPAFSAVVVYISGRSDSLALLFFLSSLILWIKLLDTEGVRKWILWGLSLLTFCMAMGSRENMSFSPLLISWAAWMLGKSHISPKSRNFWYQIPFYLIVAGYWILRSWLLIPASLPDQHVAPTLSRWILVPRALGLYYQVLICPYSLYMERTVSDVSMAAGSFWWILGVGGSLVLFVIAWKSRKSQPLITWGIGWFFLMIAPVSNLIPLSAANAAEHWTYFPAVGLVLAAGAGFAVLQTRAVFISRERLVFGGLVIVAVLFTLRGQERNKDWQDPETFYVRTLAKNPNSTRIQYNLKSLQIQNDKAGEMSALKSTNKGVVSMVGLGGEIASKLLSEDQNEQALAMAMKLMRTDPLNPLNYMVAAKASSKMSNTLVAEKILLRGLKYNFDNKRLWSDLACVYETAGRYPAAEKAFLRALEIEPTSAQLWNDYGLMMGRQGKWDEAEKAFIRAARCDTWHTASRKNLGLVYWKTRRFDLALPAYRKVLNLDPENVEILWRIGMLEWTLGMYPQAMKTFARVRELAPAVKEVDGILANIQNQQKIPQEYLATANSKLEGRPELAPLGPADFREVN